MFDYFTRYGFMIFGFSDFPELFRLEFGIYKFSGLPIMNSSWTFQIKGDLLYQFSPKWTVLERKNERLKWIITYKTGPKPKPTCSCRRKLNVKKRTVHSDDGGRCSFTAMNWKTSDQIVLVQWIICSNPRTVTV